jgi:hypothetical protein
MEDARECAVCSAPVGNKPPTYKTCGHPRCVRTHRARMQKRRDSGVVKSTRRLAQWTAPDIMAPDTRGRMRVVDAWDRLDGSPEWQRIPEAARMAGESVAVTISVLRAEGRLR